MKRILTTSVYRAKCYYCDCEFEYQQEDVFFNSMRGVNVVSCPNCHRHIDHKENPKSKTTTEYM